MVPAFFYAPLSEKNGRFSGFHIYTERILYYNMIAKKDFGEAGEGVCPRKAMTRTLKIWCGALALLLLTGCAEAAPQNAPEAAEEAVSAVQETLPEPVYEKHEAYMSAENGFFEPERHLSRAQATQMVCTLAGLKEADAPEIVFADVSPENWYYAPVHTAAAYFMEDEEPAEASGEALPDEETTQAPPDEEPLLFRPRDTTLASELQDALTKALGLPETALPEGLEDATPLTRADAARLVNELLGRVPDEAALREVSFDLLLDVSKDDPAYFEILEAILPHEYLENTSEQWNAQTLKLSPLRAGAHTKKGAGYVVDEEGRAIRQAGLFDFGGWTYLAEDETGRIFADSGLHRFEGQVYYARRGGQLLQNAALGAYLFDENGRYTTGRADVDALLDEAIAAFEEDGMTREALLRACYDYVRSYKYLGRNAAYGPEVKTPPYENLLDFAEKILTTGKGDCYNFAAGFCLLARRLGFAAECVIGECGYVWNWRPIAHGWVEITQDGQTLLYDPQIENYNTRAGISNEENGAFGVTYETAHAKYLKH